MNKGIHNGNIFWGSIYYYLGKCFILRWLPREGAWLPREGAWLPRRRTLGN